MGANNQALGGTGNAGYNAILNGDSNYTCNYFNFIGNGEKNHACVDYLAEVNVAGNHTDSAWSILGGCSNTIEDGADCSVIAGGNTNVIYSAIAGAIAEGDTNTINTGSDHSIIGGGMSNAVGSASPCSVIVGGQGNQVTSGGVFGFIGGGTGNILGPVFQQGAIGGGTGNAINGSADNFIGGGNSNKIVTAAAACGVIAGGSGNQVSGAYSAILGGQNNSDGGNPFTGMFGNGLLASAFVTPAPIPPSAFWVDTMVALNVPNVTAAQYVGLPIGAIYTIATGGYGIQQLFIK